MDVEHARLAILQMVKALQPNAEISPDDTMYDDYAPHYFGVGRSAILTIATALTARLAYPGGDAVPQTILDCGAGYGRVARYLRAAFPAARVEVDDYAPDGPRWCAENLGCHLAEKPIVRDRFDLIWLGSVFTHLPEDEARALLATMVAALRPRGTLIFTAGGRLGIANIVGHLERRTDARYASYNMKDEEIRQIVRGYNERDYGYCDYHNQRGYGSAIVKPAWYAREASRYPLVQLGFQEMAWDTHQDVYAYMRLDDNLVAYTQDKGAYY